MGEVGRPCPVKPCCPALTVHPYHSHTYICSSSWYVCMYGHRGTDLVCSLPPLREHAPCEHPHLPIELF